jgi:glycosyltransferase involved in cell wall biosynthesis
MDITVIIATRNRADSLRETLEDLAKQDTAGNFTYEVLVSDNGSTDNTAEVVKSIQAQFQALRYCYEAHPGKAYALNSAISQTQSPVIAFTYDDCRFEKNWLRVIWEAFQKQKADGVGGPSKPLIEGKRPAWLSDRLVKQLGYINYGNEPFMVQDRKKHVFIGTNHAYRREMFERLGGFDVNRIGNSEDVEFFQRVYKAGGKLFYEPKAVAMHKLEASRWTPKSLAARFFLQGRAMAYGMQESGRGLTVCRIPFWTFRELLSIHWNALKSTLRGDKEEALWEWLRRYFYFGAIYYCFMDWLQRRPTRYSRPPV